jgi:hypothetical protein
MAVVALVAANLAALRALEPPSSAPGLFLVGLLPLIDAQLIGVYCLVSRQRISPRNGASQDVITAAATFAAVNLLVLCIAIAICAIAQGAVMAYLRRIDMQVSSTQTWSLIAKQPLGQVVALSLVLGTVISAPPLILSVATSWLLVRCRVIIVRRHTPATPTRNSTGPLR